MSEHHKGLTYTAKRAYTGVCGEVSLQDQRSAGFNPHVELLQDLPKGNSSHADV